MLQRSTILKHVYFAASMRSTRWMNGSKIQGTLSASYIHDRMKITNRQMLTTFPPTPKSSPGQESSTDARLLLWPLGMQDKENEKEKNNLRDRRSRI